MTTATPPPRHLGARRYRLESASVHNMTEPAVAMSVILGLIASGQATTRPAIARALGLSPATAGAHLDTLVRHRLIAEGQHVAPVGRGRPARSYSIPDSAGVVLAVSLTARRLELAVMTVGQRCLAYEAHAIAISDGPDIVLGMVVSRLRGMLAELPPLPVLVVSVGLPGPVDSHQGIPVRPPIMPGWDGHPVAAQLSEEFGCPTVVDNDVNLMALGESRALPDHELPLLYLKVGTGVGSGLVTSEGRLYRGAHGAAGDIGHIRVLSDRNEVCTCGNVNCLEAVAGAAAMTRLMREELGDDDLTQDDFIAAVRAGTPEAMRIVREAAITLGEAAAVLVHLYNPARICLGGALSGASDDLLAGIRSVVYQRALPLATRNLTLAHSVLGADAAIVGASVAGIDAVLSPAVVEDHLLDRL